MPTDIYMWALGSGQLVQLTTLYLCKTVLMILKYVHQVITAAVLLSVGRRPFP